MEIELIRRKNLTKVPFIREKRVPFLVELTKPTKQKQKPVKQQIHTSQIYQNEQIHPPYSHQVLFLSIYLYVYFIVIFLMFI